jgi:hypothetical protein
VLGKIAEVVFGAAITTRRTRELGLPAEEQHSKLVQTWTETHEETIEKYPRNAASWKLWKFC